MAVLFHFHSLQVVSLAFLTNYQPAIHKCLARFAAVCQCNFVNTCGTQAYNIFKLSPKFISLVCIDTFIRHIESTVIKHTVFERIKPISKIFRYGWRSCCLTIQILKSPNKTKSFGSNTCQTFRQNDRSQTLTAIKCIRFDACHPTGNIDFCQVPTLLKRTLSNIYHTLGNSDFSNVITK